MSRKDPLRGKCTFMLNVMMPLWMANAMKDKAVEERIATGHYHSASSLIRGLIMDYLDGPKSVAGRPGRKTSKEKN